MSKRDAVVLASRTLALLLLVWTFSEFCSLPDRLVSYILRYEPTTPYVVYLRTSHLAALISVAARIIGFSVLANWLFKAGPEVAATLLPPEPGKDFAQG